MNVVEIYISLFERNVFVEIKIYFVVNGFVFYQRLSYMYYMSCVMRKCAFYIPGL